MAFSAPLLSEVQGKLRKWKTAFGWIPSGGAWQPASFKRCAPHTAGACALQCARGRAHCAACCAGRPPHATALQGVSWPAGPACGERQRRCMCLAALALPCVRACMAATTMRCVRWAGAGALFAPAHPQVLIVPIAHGHYLCACLPRPRTLMRSCASAKCAQQSSHRWPARWSARPERWSGVPSSFLVA